MREWTPEQAQAIGARNQNLLVAAAAGSGKTAVLVERIIGLLLLDGINVDQLLVVTFTNAAAGEMRERIAAAIAQELERNPKQEAHLRKQMTLLNQASISTLHAFCIQVVRSHFHLLELDPGFRIGDVTENSLLEMEALEEVLEAAYEQEDPCFFQLVEAYGGNRGDGPLQELVLQVYHFIQSQPDPQAWLKEQADRFWIKQEALETSPWALSMKKGIELRLLGAQEAFQAAKELCLLPGGPVAYLTAIEGDLEQTGRLQQALLEGIAAFYAQGSLLAHARLGRRGKEEDPELAELAKEQRDQGKKILFQLWEDYFSLSPSEAILEMNEMAPLMAALYQVVSDFSETYQRKKQEKGLLDFNDLEHFALRILEDPLVARQYQQKYAYIFVDEYQDSNLVQEVLLSRIKGARNLFMVGDVKQSIYRFRLADPSLFMEKYRTFERHSESLSRRIDLSKNFRSRGEILRGVNFIFRHLMSRTLGEIEYDEQAALHEGAVFPPAQASALELNLLEKAVETSGLEEELEQLEDVEAEAHVVAQRIKELMEEEIFDGSVFRKPCYQDMVILLRSTQNWAGIFYEVLTAAGIPTYADSNTGYFENIEISQFMSLLQVIDNKRQDIPLLSLMRSPVGGFTTEELVDIRIFSPKGSYYEGVEAYASEGPEPLKGKVKAFLEQVARWAEAARYMKLDDFIWRLLMETGFYHYVGAMPGGPQRQANLRVLLDRAVQFRKTSIKGLFHFIHFISRIQKSQGDMGSAKVLNENDQVVRIMSIHKSKGLEFPVVIVAGLGKGFNLRDSSQPLLLHKDLGLGPSYVDSEKRLTRDTLAKLAMKDQIKLESLSEEMRVLYVALTRPKDRLILVASGRKLESLCQKGSRGPSLYGHFSSRSYLAWLLPLLLRHPDGGVLRELGGITLAPGQLFPHESVWQIKLFSKEQLHIRQRSENQRRAALREQLIKREALPPYQEQPVVDRRLNWQYLHQEALLIPSKLSVTDIKQAQFRRLESLGHKIPPLVKMPKFIESVKTFTGAEKGTILHFVLQHLDLSNVASEEAIRLQLESMCHRQLLTWEEAAVVQVEKLLNFFHSPIGRRLLQAETVRREVPFNLKMRAADVLDEVKQTDQTLLVQGVIDCYFQEGEKLVLLDYKSDFLFEGDQQAMEAKYRVQLELYQQALEKITGKQVKERILYLFHLDQGWVL